MSDITKIMPRSYSAGGGSVLMSAPYSFLKAAYVPLDKNEIERSGAKAIFLGVPFESGNFSRPGSSWGPKGLRIYSEQFSSYSFEFDIDLFDFYHLIDCGDVQVIPSNIEKTLDNIEKGVSQILLAGALPIICGGDHSIPIASMRALSKVTKGNVGYIHFDAHMDTAEDIGGERYTSCCPVSRAIDLPNLDPKNIVMIGIRGTLNPPNWCNFSKKYNLKIYTMPEIWERGIERVIRESMERAGEGTEAIYVSVDTDSIDAAFAPGTTCPEPYGLTSKEIIIASRLLGTEKGYRKIKIIDVMEYCPQYDVSGITAFLLNSVIVNFLASRAKSLRQLSIDPSTVH